MCSCGSRSCFAQALDDAGIPETPGLRETLVVWFHRGVELMDAHPVDPDAVPEGLTVPRWSWDGPVG